VGALPGLIAHGGVAGAVVESLVVLAVIAVLVAVWLRERRAAHERRGEGAARLTDDDEAPQS
jgi:hypothetical protein